MANEIITAKYNELSEKIPTLTAGTYDLTVDCTGVNNETIKGFGRVLGTAQEGVYFNLIPTNVGSDVTDATQMFGNCSSLVSVDTSGLTGVTNANQMFYYCDNLTNITWAENFFPAECSEMFLECSKTINIDTKDWYTNTYITNNASNMGLTNYKLLNEYPKPEVPIVESLAYSELTKQYMMLYEPRTEPYNLVLDCANADVNEFKGLFPIAPGPLIMSSPQNPSTPKNSPLMLKLSSAPIGVKFNLSIAFPDNLKDATMCFAPKITSDGGLENSNLVSVNITNENINIINADAMFSGCNNLTSITFAGAFLPYKYYYMFSGCSKTINIDTKDWYTNTYITNNASNMGLTSFNLVNEYPKPDVSIVENLKYSELTRQYMMLYEPRPEPYNLVLDCANADVNEFKGFANPDTGEVSCSPLILKLISAPMGVRFNLSIAFPDNLKDATMCFAPTVSPAGIPGYSNLVSIIITNENTNISNASSMFYGCSNLTSIDTKAFTKVTDASQMFSYCENLAEVTGTSAFTKVTNTERMFNYCNNLTSIDTSVFTNVTNASSMFNMCSSLTEVTGTNVFTSVTDASYMFLNCSSLTNIDTSGFTSVTNADSMFGGCSRLTSIDTSVFTNVTNADSMFDSCDNLTNITWGDSFRPTQFEYMFFSATATKTFTASDESKAWIESNADIMSLTNYNLGEKPEAITLTYTQLDTELASLEPHYTYKLTVNCEGVNNSTLNSFGSKLNAAPSDVYFNLKPINVGSDVTSANHMFYNCKSLTSIDTSAFTSVTDASSMFDGCSNLKEVAGTSGFTKVTDARSMFSRCSSLTSIDTSGFTSVTIAQSMFQNCSNLTELTGASVFTSVTNAGFMFEGCSRLTSIDTSGFTSVTDASNMFQNCSRLTSIDTKAFTNVTDAHAMFYYCSNLTSIVWKNLLPTNYNSMFYNCPQAKNIEVDWFTRTYLTKDKISNMNLENYTLTGGDVKPDIPEILPYNDLKKSLMFLYEPRPEPYNLTVDCTGVAASEFRGNGNTSSFGLKLKTAQEGVYFNLTPTNVGNDVNNTSSMFNNCSNLTSIDTSGFTSVTDASDMFNGCSNLTNITWGDLFRPTSHNSMFSNVTAKTIKASTDSQKWINTNASTMSLSNYSFGEKSEPITLTYTQLDTELASLESHYTYNLTVDCTGVNSSNIKEIGAKLKAAPEEVLFNLTLSSIEPNVTDVSSMFSNCDRLVRVDISALNPVIDSSSMFNNCINLKNIIWKNWVPTKYDSMFNNCPKQKNIDVDYYTKSFISGNVNSLGLVNYTLNGGDEKPPISETIHFNDLLESSTLYFPRSEPYNLTVDCSGVDNPTLKGFGNILNTAQEGVYFNLTPTNIGETITDTSTMFSECKKLTSIDTSNFLNVTNSTNMFSYCDNLEKVIWGGSFRPITNNDMFFKINKLITIIASIDSEKWIGDNVTSMSLSNYNLSYDFDLFKYRLDDLNVKSAELGRSVYYWKKKADGSRDKELSVKYSELDTEIPKLKPFSICNLTVDCTGVDPNEFIGVYDESASPFWVKLNTYSSIGFNLTLKNIPDTVTDMGGCFMPNQIYYDYCEGVEVYENSNLLSINIANKPLKVTDASYMFKYCSSLTSIDTSGFTSVTIAQSMFQNCSNLTSIIWGSNFLPDMYSGMFTYCDKQINIDTKDWYTNTYITNNASNMGLTNYKLLNEYPKPDVPILESLKYSELTKQYMMLYDPRTEPYNLTVDCTGVNNETIKGFERVLGTAQQGIYFNLTPINVGSDVTDASSMFSGCSSLVSIDTSAFISVTNTSSMFSGCSSLTSITWGDSFRPTNFSYMFYEATATKTITASDESKAWINEKASSMSLSKYNFGEKSEAITLTYAQLDTELAGLEPHYIYNLTVNCEGVDNATLKSFGSKLKAAPEGVFFNLTPTNVGSDVTDASSMFSNCSSLVSIDTSGFTSVTNAHAMFYYCSSLTSIDTKAFTSVTNAGSMFQGCSSLTNIDTSVFTKVTDASSMFNMCSSLTEVTGTNVFTSVTDASYMFNNCSSLTSIDTSAFTKVENAPSMFANCSNLIEVAGTSGFTSVTNADSMFDGCSRLTSIDTSGFTSVTDASNMFYYCSNLTSLTWGDSFRPTSFNYMFDEATAAKTITASADSKSWIETNGYYMNLTNYTIVLK